MEGGRACQGGIVSVCSANTWLQTALTCAAKPGDAAQPLVPPPPPQRLLIHVLAARYRAGDAVSDFVFALRQRCDGKVVCVIGGDLLQNDPAPHLRGTFTIAFSCTTGFDTRDSKQVVFAKDAPQTLSCRE
jgi:hypothetical protein